MYKAAMKNLALGTDLPIVGRIEEKDTIRSFIKQGLDNRSQKGVIYVSGPPGAGKTKCVTEIITEFERSHNCNVVSVNIKHLLKPREIYKTLYQQMFYDNKFVTAAKAKERLHDYFDGFDAYRRQFISKIA